MDYKIDKEELKELIREVLTEEIIILIDKFANVLEYVDQIRE